MAKKKKTKKRKAQEPIRDPTPKPPRKRKKTSAAR